MVKRSQTDLREVCHMARVPYVEPSESPAIAELYSGITGLRGSVLNLYKAVANQPPALEAFMHMSRYVRDDSSLPPHLRELAILATAYALDVEYEKYHHVRAGRQAGISEEQLAAFPAWRDRLDLFDERERAVLSFADQVARRREVDRDTFEAARSLFSESGVVDLTVTVGWYHLCAAVVGALQIETETPQGR
jgi:alkylhydroperoxidase family enzyme